MDRPRPASLPERRVSGVRPRRGACRPLPRAGLLAVWVRPRRWARVAPAVCRGLRARVRTSAHPASPEFGRPPPSGVAGPCGDNAALNSGGRPDSHSRRRARPLALSGTSTDLVTPVRAPVATGPLPVPRCPNSCFSSRPRHVGSRPVQPRRTSSPFSKALTKSHSQVSGGVEPYVFRGRN